MPPTPLIFIIAGEASGDQLGADLMARLKALQDVRFAGIGGPAMAAQGLTSLFPMEELSIMGIGGILRQLPHLLRRLRDTVETIQHLKPDAVVTIDAPEFSFRILKRLHGFPSRPRLIHYVAPTVWAWRPGRARKISRFVDLLLCLYPFEPPYFEKHGLKSIFVGHPVASLHASLRDPGEGESIHFEPSLRAERSNPEVTSMPTGHTTPSLEKNMMNSFGISDLTGFLRSARNDNRGYKENLLCLLPGSRRSEIETLLPIFKETIALLKKEMPDLHVILPTLPTMKTLIEEKIQDWTAPVQIVVGEAARDQAFQQASAALAASGTVTLQLAVAGLPFIITYKIGKLNEWIGRALLKTPWACMVNILLAFDRFGPGFVLNRQAKERIKEPWIPEFLQQDCTPENLSRALIKLLRNPKVRHHQEQAMAQAIHLLRASHELAAQSVLEEVNKAPPPAQSLCDRSTSPTRGEADL